MNGAEERPQLAPLAVPGALAALTLGTVIALDAPTMLLLVLLWCTVWIATLTPRRVLGWTAPAQRLAASAGAAWTALFLSLLISRRVDEFAGGTMVTAGLPSTVTYARVAATQSPLVANLSWLWQPGIEPPHVYQSDDCAGALLVLLVAAGFAVAWLPAAWLPRLLAVLRLAAPLAAAAVFAMIPFTDTLP